MTPNIISISANPRNVFAGIFVNEFIMDLHFCLPNTNTAAPFKKTKIPTKVTSHDIAH